SHQEDSVTTESTTLETAAVEGDGHLLVDAEPARQHLLALQTAKVGLRSVNARSGVARSTLELIRSGRRTQILAATAAKILDVTPGRGVKGPSLAPTARTALRLAEILAAGRPRDWLARRCGLEPAALDRPRPAMGDAVEAVAAELGLKVGDDG